MANMIHKYGEGGRWPRVGDRVLIQDVKLGRRWNYDGLMDKYLSKVMTVRAINRSGDDFSLKMEEDLGDTRTQGGWNWFPEMIAGVIIGEIDEDTSEWLCGSCITDLLM